MSGLSEEEQKKLDNLLEKDDLTEAEQATLVKLLEKSGVANEELEEFKEDLPGFTEPIKTKAKTRKKPESKKEDLPDFPEKKTPRLTRNQRKAITLVRQLGDDAKQDFATKVDRGEFITQAYINKLEALVEEKKRKEKETESESKTETEPEPKEPEKTRKGAGITRPQNKKILDNLANIAQSEAEKRQIKEILEKRKKTLKDQRLLNDVAKRIKQPSTFKKSTSKENLGTPFERRQEGNTPAGAPFAKIKSQDGGGGPEEPNIPIAPEAPPPEVKPEPANPKIKLQTKKELEPLPKLEYPSTTIVLAKKFSGKTNLLLNIVDKNKFDNVWVVSLTGFTGKLDALCEDEDCLLEDIGDEMINELLKLHKNEQMNSLIVFDDVIGQVDMRSKGMNKLATMGRNFGISIIISSQDFFKVPPVWRRNAEYWYIGSLTDSNVDAVAKELSTPTFQKRRIRQELSVIARDKKYDWLFYDDRKTNFKKLLGIQFKRIV